MSVTDFGQIRAMRQDIRDQFPNVVFPTPTIEPVFWGKDKKELIPNSRAVVDYDTGNVMSVCSKRYALVHHEDVLRSVIEKTKTLKNIFGKPEIAVNLLNQGARMVFNITWPEASKDVKVGDPVCPLFRGFNSYDSSTRLGANFGMMRLVCSNGMILADKYSTSSYDRKHVGEANVSEVEMYVEGCIEAFNDGFTAMQELASKVIEPETYDYIWGELNFSEREREKIEALPLIGFDNTTLSSFINRKADGTVEGQVTAWMLQAAMTQFTTHEMKVGVRQLELAPKIGKLFLNLNRHV